MTTAPGSRVAAILRGCLRVRGSRVRQCVFLVALALARPAVLHAHPAPFSYLDVRIDAASIQVSIVVHVLDVAHEIQAFEAADLLDGDRIAAHREAILSLLSARAPVLIDGQPIPREAWSGPAPVPDRDALRLQARTTLAAPEGAAVIGVTGPVFPYDPNHQTFVTIYEGGVVVKQGILVRDRPSLEHFTGTRQGRFAVIRRFAASGVHHILIGPDHLLFLVGLLLMGGSVRRLLLVVSAFTLAHSVTLSLAALDAVTPPVWVVEPAIALSIVYVGADNLTVQRLRPERGAKPPSESERGWGPASTEKRLRRDQPPLVAAAGRQLRRGHAGARMEPWRAEAEGPARIGEPPRDVRAWIAFGFGLIHGFGFANVLREMDLPQAALGWSLLAFNAGVELGQLVVVIPVALVLAAVRSRSEAAARWLVVWGSIVVIAAGAFWFFQRIFQVP